MHTHTENGIDITLANELGTTFAWVPPLVTEAGHPDDYFAGQESISLEEINEAFNKLEKEKQASQPHDVDGAEVLEGQVYVFQELDRIDEGRAPHAVDEDVTMLWGGSSSAGSWDLDAILTLKGVSSR